ncbi:MAG TPA: sugar ABC transporter permease [Chthoniobacterales bacterium]
MRRHRGHQEALWGFLFIFPTYLGFLIFVLGPLVAVAAISLTKFDLFGGTTFIGPDNYTRMWSDDRLKTVYPNTALFTVFAVFFNLTLGLGLAVLLNARMPAFLRNFFRSIYFFPVLIAHTYVAVIWEFLFQRDTGVVNYYLQLIGIGPVSWLSDPGWVIASAVAMTLFAVIMGLTICQFLFSRRWVHYE